MSKFRLQSYICSFPSFLKRYTPFIFTLAIPRNLIKPGSNFFQQFIKILLTLYVSFTEIILDGLKYGDGVTATTFRQNSYFTCFSKSNCFLCSHLGTNKRRYSLLLSWKRKKWTSSKLSIATNCHGNSKLKSEIVYPRNIFLIIIFIII